MEQNQLNKIKEIANEFFAKMTLPVLKIEASSAGDAVNLELKMDEPQIVIGQQGQTLFEIQRLLRMITNKRLQKVFYLNLDINNYKAQKVEYLKDLAKNCADQAVLLKQEKDLPPMSSYERRIIHAELSQRADVATESRGSGQDRHIVIKPN